MAAAATKVASRTVLCICRRGRALHLTLRTRAVGVGVRAPNAAQAQPWQRLVRFVNATGQIRVGEPVGAAGEYRHARLLDGGGDVYRHDAALTDVVEPIVKLLAPIVPTVVLCIGLNYRKHAQETGNPVPRYPIAFAKNLSAVQNPHDPVVLPAVAVDPPEVDYEAELAFVVGRPCKNVTPGQAMDYVLGFMCANDISARRWQGKRGGGQWYTGKSFDTFCPLGPELVSPAAVGDPQALGISFHLNGTLMQSSNTSDMIFGVRSLVSFLSQETTLLPGTVVITGTPEGVGFTRKPPVFLKPGDRMRVAIDRLGVLENTVVASTTPGAVWAAPDDEEAAGPTLQTAQP